MPNVFNDVGIATSPSPLQPIKRASKQTYRNFKKTDNNKFTSVGKQRDGRRYSKDLWAQAISRQKTTTGNQKQLMVCISTTNRPNKKTHSSIVAAKAMDINHLNPQIHTELDFNMSFITHGTDTNASICK
jgi:hypothetical protein